jgi:hypothetical protein
MLLLFLIHRHGVHTYPGRSLFFKGTERKMAYTQKRGRVPQGTLEMGIRYGVRGLLWFFFL